MCWNFLFLAIFCSLNCREHITKFCQEYTLGLGVKALSKDDLLFAHHWQELKYLYDHLEAFYKAIIMVEGKHTGLMDYFQIFDWLLLKLEKMQQKFIELAAQKCWTAKLQNYKQLAGCSEAA